MKVLVFAEREHMQFFKATANLSYDQNCCPFSDHTNITYDQLAALKPCTKTEMCTPFTTHID